MSSIEAPAVALLVALILTGVVSPLVARLAARTGVVAAPRPDRWGARPTPLLGGVAIVFGFLVPVMILMPANPTLTAIAVGVLAALVLGLLDDIRGLSPTSKLVGQVVIASGLALSGVRIEIVQFPPASFVLTLLWVVVVMNALNLVDNMDGLAAGIAAIAAAVLVFMAPADPQWPRVLAAAIAGASVGFLVYNFSPARIYMGDAGSLSLGFLLAALALVLTNTAASNVGLAIFAPLLALGVPIFDTALVTLVRRVEGRPVTQGGRDHTSHRLAALGLSEREAVLVLYAVGASMALLGLLANALGLAFIPVVALLVVSLILFGVFVTEQPTLARPGVAPPVRASVLGGGRRLIRYGGEIALDVALAMTALLSAYLIRFEAFGVHVWMPLFVAAAPIVVPIQLGAFVLLGVYHVLWRYFSVVDVLVIARAVVVGTLAASLVVLLAQRELGQSRAGFVLDGLLLVVLVTGSRMFLVSLRHWSAFQLRVRSRRVLIVGANDTGVAALRLLLQSKDPLYRPAGFVDDDPGKIHRRIAGVPVLGRVSDLVQVAERQRADLVLLALEGEPERNELVRRECSSIGLELREFARSV